MMFRYCGRLFIRRVLPAFDSLLNTQSSFLSHAISFVFVFLFYRCCCFVFLVRITGFRSTVDRWELCNVREGRTKNKQRTVRDILSGYLRACVKAERRAFAHCPLQASAPSSLAFCSVSHLWFAFFFCFGRARYTRVSASTSTSRVLRPLSERIKRYAIPRKRGKHCGYSAQTAVRSLHRQDIYCTLFHKFYAARRLDMRAKIKRCFP